MTGMTVSEWRKYGKHRLYVNTADGVRVGWLDVSTGLSTIEEPGHTDAFHAAIAHHCTGADTSPAAAPTADADFSAERASVPPEPDLASHRPGQGIREVADAKWTARKERSTLGAWIGRAIDAKTDERAYRVGAAGEEAVGKRLEKLTGKGWFVLHSVPVGDRGSDIDHVLIGHGGVYTINTKNHPGAAIWVGKNTVRVNGHSVAYLQKSRYEAERASRLLTAAVGFTVSVKAALVLLTGTLNPNVTVKSAPDGVLILDRMDVPGAFKRAPRRLDGEQIAAIHEAARRPTTWSGRASG